MRPNVRPDAGDSAALGGSAEPVAPPPYPMGALEAALRGLGCQCGHDVDGHEASEHLTPGEREVFEQINAALARAPQGDPPESGALALPQLPTEWRARASERRQAADALLSNRAGTVERESLLGRARAYETCAEELQFALSAKRVPAAPSKLLDDLWQAHTLASAQLRRGYSQQFEPGDYEEKWALIKDVSGWARDFLMRVPAPQGDAAPRAPSREAIAPMLGQLIDLGPCACVAGEICPAHRYAMRIIGEWGWRPVGGASSSGSTPAPDPEKFRRALQKLLSAHGEWAQCRPGDLQRVALADAAVAAENVVVALYEEALGLDRGSPRPTGESGGGASEAGR